MVWIHGGGFNGGTNFEYPGYFMAEKDVVYVALNYRLGMLGTHTQTMSNCCRSIIALFEQFYVRFMSCFVENLNLYEELKSSKYL